MADAAAEYLAAWREGLRPPDPMTVSEWADRHRMLSRKGSSEPGPWRTDRTPYLREPMDCLSPSSPWRRVVLMFGSQMGKALAIDTPILTTSGWKAMGDLQTGDEVYDMHGAPTLVTHAWPVMHDRECARITFSDGAQVVADMDHRWVVDNALRGSDRSTRLVLTTREIAAGYRVRGRNRYAVPVAGALRLPHADLPVHPYVLGVWLGDGNSHSNQVTMEAQDAKEVAPHLQACGVRVEIRRPEWMKGKAVNMLLDSASDRSVCRRGHVIEQVGMYATRASSKRPGWACAECQRQHAMASKYGKPVDSVIHRRLGEKLRTMGLIGKGSKRIPEAYLRASVKQRLELLRGLMDTDGHCTAKGAHEVTFASEQLAGDVFDLLLSLGLKPVQKRHPGHTTIRFTAYRSQPVFRLERKKERMGSAVDGRPSETRRRRIVNVEPVASVPVRCISVAADSHTYLCGRELIPTHNTEVVLNWLGAVIHLWPGPTLLVQPTLDMAKRLNRQRLDPLLRETPVLADLIAPSRSRDSGNTMFLKEFRGGLFVLTGANSGSGLQSMPAAYLAADEVSSYPLEADDKGDPLENAETRTSTFPMGKVLITSTPGTRGACRITEEFERRSDRRQLAVLMPCCGAREVLRWREHMRWDRPDGEVWAQCPACGERVAEHCKTSMLLGAEWRASSQGDGITAGFHLPGWYAPAGWTSWGLIRDEFLRAKGDPLLLKGWVNKRAAEAWEDEALARVNADGLMARAAEEPYETGRCPVGVLLLLMAVDVQDTWLEVSVWGLGRGEEGWLVWHQKIQGDPADLGPDGPWVQVDAVRRTQWPREEGGVMVVRHCGVDTGGHFTQEAYEFCRQRVREGVVALKGSSTRDAVALSRGKKVDTNWRGRVVKGGVTLYLVGGDGLKRTIYARLKKGGAGGGVLHFGQNATEEYLEGLTCERLVPRSVKGFQVLEWQKPSGARNEPLDLLVYCLALLELVKRRYHRATMWDQLAAAAGAPVPAATPAAPAAPRERRRSAAARGGGFVQGW